ncbi:MAG: hypothetical protein HC816_15805 [Leptolyngbyaceae cyanobacterium RM1_1_2]|nr:hypothetical protein [Leptolyngbyaceae cyanobacterium RM1_1_2]
MTLQLTLAQNLAQKTSQPPLHQKRRLEHLQPQPHHSPIPVRPPRQTAPALPTAATQPLNTPDPDPSGQSQPADSSDSSENNSDSDSQNNSADADDPDSDETGNSNTTGTSGTGNTDNTNNQASNSSDPPSGSQGADDGFGTANVSGDAPGQNPSFTAQLSTLQVQQNADDIPDRVPTLVNLGPQLIVLDPLQATCEASPEALRTIQSGVAVELRITVEADGRVSDALVTNTSASFDFDSLILCLLVDAQKFEFTPAQSDGQAVPTDQVILTVTVTPS